MPISSHHANGLQPLDWLLIVVYASSTLGLGWYFGRQQRTAREYFVGRGNMNPILVGVSLFATLLSTISYLSLPGESLGKGPAHMATMLGLPLVYFIVAYGLLPVYMRYRVTSAYELLEARLGLGIRLLGATMFIALRLVWMSLLIYLAAKAMTIMLGVDDKWIPLIVAATGLVSVIYTSLGGLQAVVITDFLQTVLLLGGALVVIATVTFDFGGWGWFPTQWQDNWDVQPLFSFDPRTRLTVLGSVLSMTTWYVCTAGGDQTSVQRFMATDNAQGARRAYVVQLTMSVIVSTLLGVVGFALLAYFQAHPEQLPAEFSLKTNADDVFPRYIAYHLPVGLSGLVVAAMFAAAMSSLDSGVNSITAVVMTDFVDRLSSKSRDEVSHMRSARLLAFGIGCLVVLSSSFMEYVPGNITAVTQKTTNLLVTPIFALFFFALFVAWAKPIGVAVGALMGTATAAVIAFSGPIVVLLTTRFGIDPHWFGVVVTSKVDPVTGIVAVSAPDPISFQWIAPVALVVNIATGSFVSWLLCRSWRET